MIIGILAIAGVPYQIARELYDVSRAYYTELKTPAQGVLDLLFGDGELPKGAILVTRNFIERCVLALTFYCRAPIEGIVEFFDRVLCHPISKGSIHNIREKARRKAEEFDNSIALSSIEAIASDEIFQQGEPVLTVVDLRTRYIPLLEQAKDRTGDTWREALEGKKEQGLAPKVNVSDGGSGLRKGLQEAFPEMDMQLDVFHALRDVGRQVRQADRHVMSQLKTYCDLESKLHGQRVHQKTCQAYEELSRTIDACLHENDRLQILYGWLKEYVGFSGYGYQKTLSVCSWILDEMTLLYPERNKYQDALERFRKSLPEVLRFLLRLQEHMADTARSFHVDAHAFMLLYHQTAYPVHTEAYQWIERKLYRVFGEQLIDAREALTQILSHTYRASSMIENVNGCTRAFMDVKREIPDTFFTLLKVFFNTKKARRSRNPDWAGTSAVDRLTGQIYPEFLDIIIGACDYIICV